MSTSTQSTDHLTGTLLFTGTALSPMVHEPNPTLHICAAHQWMGKRGPHGASCKHIKELNITKWPTAMFAKWSALVNQTPSVEWNCKVVNIAKVTAHSGKLTAASLADAIAPTSAAKTDNA